jgi:hypothetical protein
VFGFELDQLLQKAVILGIGDFRVIQNVVPVVVVVKGGPKALYFADDVCIHVTFLLLFLRLIVFLLLISFLQILKQAQD